MISQRSALSRLIHIADTIVARPDLALAMQADLVEIEHEINATGLQHLVGIGTLLWALVEIAAFPLATGGAVLRLAFIAQQAREIAREHLFNIVRAGARNAGSEVKANS